jgi:uncharacterized protein YwqG
MALLADRAAFEARLREILAAHKLDSAANAIAQQIRCAIRVVRTPLAGAFLPSPYPRGQGRERREAEKRWAEHHDETTRWLKDNEIPPQEMALGCSRLGGQPDLPADFAWPEHEGRPLGFLGQFSLRDLSGMPCASALPTAGHLAFFYDWTGEPWGYDPAQGPGARVVFVPDGPVVRHRLPAALEDFDYPSPVAFEPMFTIPRVDEQTLDWRAQGVAADEIDWYEVDEALRELRPARPQHQLLGHPYRVQNPMETECQFAASGLYCGDESGYEQGFKDAALVAGIGDWMLLFQCDSDDTDYDGKGIGIGHMWGDCGLLYFWVRRQDVGARDFTRTWTILQCS